MTDLERFLDAQRDSVHQRALLELRQGRKEGHWIWFVFPQIAGLGRSDMAKFYAIASLEDAQAYLDHPVIGPRLMEATSAMLEWAGRRTATEILGPVDALKFESSMTLFDAASGSSQIFAAALEAFFGGERDRQTLERL